MALTATATKQVPFSGALHTVSITGINGHGHPAACAHAASGCGLTHPACMRACAQVQDDIVQVLQLRSPARMLSSFNRPNISYAVRYQVAGSKPPVEQIAQLIGA